MLHNKLITRSRTALSEEEEEEYRNHPARVLGPTRIVESRRDKVDTIFRYSAG